jgi:hypothetical protein
MDKLDKFQKEHIAVYGLYNDERFKSLPKKMQDKLSLIIFNNMRQNYY